MTDSNTRQLVVRAAVVEAPLDVAAHLADVQDPRCGAVVTFVGSVRNHAVDAEGEVVSLDYTAHPDAQRVLADIAARVLAEHASDGVVLVSVSHRVGPLRVGDTAIVACVAAEHRGTAYALSRELLEQVKRDLPMWKRQQTRDGSGSWVGLP
jgi:molybdopterin synthase catalytic subunit